MPPYTRSAARRQALELYKNAVVSPSATGKGTHYRWTYSSDEELPTLSQSSSLETEASFDRPVTPDEDEDEESQFQRSPTACSIELSEERESLIVEDHRYGSVERAVMERMLVQLKEQKRAVEERVARRSEAAKALEHRNNLQPKSDRPDDSEAEEILNPVGPKLPRGIIGIGRNGTWVVDDVWRPKIVLSTNQLPSIRESGEGQEVQNVPLNKVIKEDLSRDPGLRKLTPLPSFVTGNGDVQMR